MKLRPYQSEAIVAIEAEWANDRRATLLVLPTGCGKTVVFTEVLRQRCHLGRALVLAHRSELLAQAASTIRRAGLTVEVEQASTYATRHGLMVSDVVVASVSTLHEKRLGRWPRDAFATVIADESHHAAAASWRAIIDHFHHAQVLGVTATPDRGDGVGLGAVFDSVAYEYQLRDAINDGWLVPIRQHAVQVADLDLSQVRSTAGDLSESDLQRVMGIDKVLHELAGPVVELRSDRPTLVFGPGVEWAHAFAEILGGYLPAARVRAIDGTTPAVQRAEVIGAFKGGDLDVLVNCAVLTEGFDAPNASCVVMARPTKSRALYAQCLGRATRPLPGVVDGPETAEERRAAIAASAAPDALVIDFRGNAGKHQLVTPADVLAGKPLPEDVRKDVERQTGQGVDVESALAAAEERAAEKARVDEARRLRQHVQAQVAYTAREVDPFGAQPMDTGGARATARQQEVLARAGYRFDGPPSKRQAQHAFAVMGARQRAGLCTRKQAIVLHRAGVPVDALKRMSKSEASALIDHAKSNGWRVSPGAREAADAAE